MKAIRFNAREELIRDLKEKEDAIIAIDGDVGTGKTNLSYCIGCKLVRNVINLDDFITVKADKFVDVLDFERLKRRIECLRKPIIEGVCLLEVLERTGLKYDILIYCKEISDIGNWSVAYRLDITDEKDYQKTIQEHSGLDAEIVKYHYRYRPFERADYIYELVNQEKI